MSTETLPVSNPLRVLIAGAGIGGLSLAQGLRRAGVEVVVFERDRSRTDRPQGYRLHINPRGAGALRECLSAELFDLFAATSGHTPTAMTFYTERLSQLLSVDVDPRREGSGGRHHSVSRDMLRQILLTGLDDAVHFDKRCTGYQENADGTVTTRFADGTRATGDVLVAADGASSTVRTQRLPHAHRIDTGWVSIAGKLPLTPQTRALLPNRIADGPGVISAPRSVGLFLTLQEFPPPPAPDIEMGVPSFDPTHDFISWGLSLRSENLGTAPHEFERLDPTALHALAMNSTAQWNSGLRQLIRDTATEVIMGSVIRSSVPVDPWVTTNVTVLGDAIHSMTPSRGIGANTALRDAALLTKQLESAARGEVTVLDAVHAYEAEMIDYGFDAVRASLKELKQQDAFKGRAGMAVMRASLRLMDAIGPLKRRAFADLGQ